MLHTTQKLIPIRQPKCRTGDLYTFEFRTQPNKFYQKTVAQFRQECRALHGRGELHTDARGNLWWKPTQ